MKSVGQSPYRSGALIGNSSKISVNTKVYFYRYTRNYWSIPEDFSIRDKIIHVITIIL